MLPLNDHQSLPRRVWTLYRRHLFVGTLLLPIFLLGITGHRLILAVCIAASLLAAPIYSAFHNRKIGVGLRSDLRRKGLSAARIMNVSLLVAFADFMLVWILVTLRWPPGLIGTYTHIVMMLAVPCIPAAGFVFAMRQLHAGPLVLWLRRFRGTPIRGVGFPDVLGSACAGLATPITLQDHQFAHSSQWGFYRSQRSYVIFFLMLPVVGLVAAFPLVLLFEHLPPSVPPTVAAIVAISLGAGLIVWMKRHQRKMGVFELTQRNLETALPAFLHDLRTNRSRVAGFGGVVVIKVPDECWRTAVLMTLEQSALVIIDLTEPTDNLTWELHAALTKLSPDRIVVAGASADRKSAAADGDFIRQTLTQMVDAEVVSRIGVLIYPEDLGARRLFVPSEDFVREVHGVLQKAFTEESPPRTETAR